VLFFDPDAAAEPDAKRRLLSVLYKCAIARDQKEVRWLEVFCLYTPYQLQDEVLHEYGSLQQLVEQAGPLCIGHFAHLERQTPSGLQAKLRIPPLPYPDIGFPHIVSQLRRQSTAIYSRSKWPTVISR